MKKKIFILISMMIAGNCHAGFYLEEGYIKSVKANNTGSTCFLEMIPDSEYYVQPGYWSCSNISGNAMLNIARTALILNSKVVVTFDGNGEESKPVKAITIK